MRVRAGLPIRRWNFIVNNNSNSNIANLKKCLVVKLAVFYVWYIQIIDRNKIGLSIFLRQILLLDSQGLN